MDNPEHSESERKDLVSRESAPAFTHDEVFCLVCAAAPSGARILDIPAGSGAFTKRLQAANYDVVASDIVSHPALPSSLFRQADMNHSLPFEDMSFDAVVSIEGLEHIQRPFDFIRECRRILRPGGFLALSTPNISSLRSRWRWFMTGFHNKCKYPLDETCPLPRHHINMHSFPELRYLLHTNGFRLECVRTNRVKPVNWVYLPCVPLLYPLTKMVMRKAARTREHRRVVDETIVQMFSTPVLFGETLIVLARPVLPPSQ